MIPAVPYQLAYLDARHVLERAAPLVVNGLTSYQLLVSSPVVVMVAKGLCRAAWLQWREAGGKLHPRLLRSQSER